VSTTAPTTLIPDVPLPPGFVAPDEWTAGRILSHDESRAWRLIFSRDRTVTDHDACVSIRACQYSDGSLDDEIALFVLGVSWDNGLNSDQARELAAALIEAAAQLDGLVQR
jgi:hypothetical protein